MHAFLQTDGDAAGASAAVAAGPAALTRAMQRMDPRQLLQALALDVDMELLEVRSYPSHMLV